MPPFIVHKSSLKESEINDIFNLKIGGQTTREMTYTLGGGWSQKTDYTRLADQVSNNIKFLVLDNPSGYGGSNRIWFAKKSGIILQIDCIYTKDEGFLNICQKIISSFQSAQ